MMEKSKKKSFGEKLKKKLKQKIYKWHRSLAFITIIPMVFWCLSGIMHPFMAHFFKPQIKNEVLVDNIIKPFEIKVTLQDVLHQNKIEEIKNFRIISFDKGQYYQIKLKNGQVLYFNTNDGNELKSGDKLYANWLSRYFLDDWKTKISNNEEITEFNSKYKYVNRYLPVHKVSFDREDQMEIYVETTTSKLATFNPKSRQFFIWFFDVFHNWSFLDAITNNSLRIILMIFLLSVIGLSAVSGIVIYGLFWKQFKKVKTEDNQSKFRKYHRQTGLFLALFTVLFAFSGGYHALKKWDPIQFEKMVYEPDFKSKDLDSEVMNQLIESKDFKNIGLIKFKDTLFYRGEFTEGENNKVVYVNSLTKKSSIKTDVDYAVFLANYFNEKVSSKSKTNCCEMSDDFSQKSCKNEVVKETALITDFKNREYEFVNKRLPVVKVAYESEVNKTLFIETATSRLAAFITDSDRVEGYSFAIFHKFLFMDWAGKPIRDLTMTFAALGIFIVGIFGLRILLKK